MRAPILIPYRSQTFRSTSELVIEQANEILEEYAAQGFDLTLRQLYYQFVARALIPNAQRSYDRLGSIVNDARLAGRIGWNRIVDRTRELEEQNHYANPEELVSYAAGWYRRDKWAPQPYRLEVWIEKDALVGVIEGVCRELDVPFLSCRGYVSQSEAWGAAMRFVRYIRDGGQRVRILHLGDHDPSGIDMSRDIRDRMELFLARHVARPDRDFGLDRLALNMDQVRRYDPPPNPAKITDSRAVDYIARFGRESWELDALEPAVMAELIRDAVLDYRDETAWQDEVEAEEHEREILETISQRWDDVAGYLDGGA